MDRHSPGELKCVETWDQLDCRLLHAYDGMIPRRGDSYEAFPGSAYHLWWVRRGWVRVEALGRSVEAGPGQWLMNAVEVKRVQSFSVNAAIVSLWFIARWSDGHPLFDHGLPLVIPSGDGSKLEPSVAELLDALGHPRTWDGSSVQQRDFTFSAFLKLRCRFADFISAWGETLLQLGLRPMPSRPLDARIDACLAELEKSGFFACIPYARLTALSGLSRVHLDRLFLKATSLTPRAYVDRKCLSEVLFLLRDRRRSIKEIAYVLSFSGPAHFSAWFRRQTGMSPKALRELP
ncbi:MAG: AraC family transcriptional regulator [Verrucomicrobiae bacterium]|nr:AraC family transcriptional regulator [Verrucomicrobiae bacterium]